MLASDVFPESGRASEEQMVGALAARSSRSEYHLKVANEISLADEVGEGLGPQRHLGTALGIARFWRHHVIAQLCEVDLALHGRLKSCSAVRRAAASSLGSTTSRSAVRTS